MSSALAWICYIISGGKNPESGSILEMEEDKPYLLRYMSKPPLFPRFALARLRLASITIKIAVSNSLVPMIFFR
jgi:hypothetical protein